MEVFSVKQHPDAAGSIAAQMHVDDLTEATAAIVRLSDGCFEQLPDTSLTLR